MTTQRPDALRLAEILEDRYALGNTAQYAAAELRRQHARITELESQLAAIGAGGVSPLIAVAAGWQPIETAPKDSSDVLLAGKRREYIASGYWLQSAYAGNGAWIWPFVHKYPTHWIPLPAAPGPADGESNE